MKILVTIPCLYGPDHTRKSINSVIGRENVDVLLIDNGAEKSVKDALMHYFDEKDHVHLIHNEKNIYVNPAWNQAINDFLSCPEYDYLVIMNSDLIMQSDWNEVVTNRWNLEPDEILIPTLSDNLPYKVNTGKGPSQIVHEGTPGVFITLNRKQAEMIYPIPSELKVWFGDNWIYDILRLVGYKTVIPVNLMANHFHNGSQNVQRVEGISEIIEGDKVNWLNVQDRKQEIIDKFRSNK